MRILLCNERFIFRFGVDRVLIMLGQKFKAAGHEVVVMANRFDLPVVQRFATHIITAPVQFAAYPDLNEWTAQWIATRWPQIMAEAGAPDAPFDIALIGGWPFFAAIPALKQRARRVIFLEYGAVPIEGYPESTQAILRKLAALRRAFLPQASAIIAGSDFLADTQTRPQSRGCRAIHTILAGSDHIDAAMWQASGLEGANLERRGLALANTLKAQGKQLLLNLGRWEPGCYKNSDATYDILRRLLPNHPDAALLIMADPKTAAIPDDLQGRVHPIGFPDDQEMLEIMRRTNVGLSVSLWEGHNLPLSEMQWLDRPALAFDLAAHPEVVLDPWYLCRDNAEMASKASDVLSGRGPTPAQRAAWQKRHRDYFTWDRAASDYLRVFRQTLQTPEEIVSLDAARLHLIFDVTNASRDTANSGVIRVTRRFARELQNHLAPRFAVWDASARQYVLLNEYECPVLGRYNGPVASADARTPADAPRVPLESVADLKQPGTWLILGEVMGDIAERRQWAAERGIRTAAVFYDAIPVLRPDLVSDIVRQGHGRYMEALAEMDAVVAISGASREDLRRFWLDRHRRGGHLVANLLPGEFGGAARITAAPQAPAGTIRMLCVSTIEPRKNHRGLLAALERLTQRHPELDWSLTLVGNRYAEADDLFDFVQQAAAANPRIKLAGVVDDATLRRLYEESTFTLYPSLIEGFGMPIVESLWHARPCICSRQSVMGELAAGGGCLATDVSDPNALAEAIHQLATDAALYARLAAEAIARPMKTWDDYAMEWLNLLVHDTPALAAAPTGASDGRDMFYASGSAEPASIGPAERLALTGLLARLQPHCAIAVGATGADLLSLLHQYARMTFALSDGREPAGDLKSLRHISRIPGPVDKAFPLLMAELKAQDLPPALVLIDAVSNDPVLPVLAPLLDAPPSRAMFVVVHHAGRADCHHLLANVKWALCPHVQWIDLDLVPGRGAAAGEAPAGGLALAFLSPIRREGPLATHAPR